jgi:hypothetical protein
MTLGPAIAHADGAPHGPYARHVLERTVVLPELRVLFVPVPKAGCTSVLWVLAELAGIPAEHFARSAQPEVSPALTIHDTALWRPENRLGSYASEEREQMLADEGWFRFTLVRDPATRLWSAWQSKLLLREPRFLERFGEASWFPRIPRAPHEIVEDFQRFVAALGRGADEDEDVHWAVQRDLVEQLPLSHVGRLERLADTLDRLRAHVGRHAGPGTASRENRSLLPLPRSAYDAAATQILQARYRADYATFGYAVPTRGSEPSHDWQQRTAALLPALRATIDEHARVGQLHAVAARRARKLEHRPRVAPARAAESGNLEGEPAFEVSWAWAQGSLEPGFTGVVRVKNEARSLPWVLPPLLAAVRRVLLIDNGSTDGTPDVALRVAESLGRAERLEVHRYPFLIARCGEEHLQTPAASVHSLAHFYNWSFSHVRTAYALKWDGDMVLTDAAVESLRDLEWQLEAAEAVVRVPRYPLYVVDDRSAFVDLALRNCEPWGWPNGPGYRFAKALEWELPLWGSDVTTVTLPDWGCVELKHLDADEFAHWSATDFNGSVRTQRKRREWEVFHALASGAPAPDGVVPVRSPDERHVVEYVRSTWLPARGTALG